ncbi:hypothetical protein CYR34_06560 [Chimaeribacter arupi]|uniref:Uncharacterized protein n=1 Tax=Chimaeribacter arupi TaxID=2060066 RepID=A0A2N5EQN3_9GAMM|nr:hypothetical protein CYR34_06560 [Chimaeribacter arupi]
MRNGRHHNTAVRWGKIPVRRFAPLSVFFTHSGSATGQFMPFQPDNDLCCALAPLPPGKDIDFFSAFADKFAQAER